MNDLDVTKSVTLTAEDVQAMEEAAADAALDNAMSAPRPESVEIERWWDLYARGPYQHVAPGGPLRAHQVIKLGETAYVTTVILLNARHIVRPGPISPCQLLTGYDSIEIRYQSGNLTTWAQGGLNVVHSEPLVVDQCRYVHTQEFTPQQEGMFSLHISARIVAPGSLFAGFARWVGDYDPGSIFGTPTPGYQFDMPIRYMVYSS